ncbi:MAG: GHKL domain-containing protein [Flavobacteriales bacterium]|nr:GHKL domain-containing protein [Flavobacteriales bacterium]
MLFADKTTDDQFIKKEELKLGKELEAHLEFKKNEAFGFLRKAQLINEIGDQSIYSPEIEALSNANFNLIATRNDTLFFWNSNLASVDSISKRNSDSVFIREIGRRVFLVCKKEVSPYKIYLLYLAGDYSDSPELPDNHPLKEDNAYIYNLGDYSSGYELKWLDGKSYARFNIIDIENINRSWVVLGLILLMIFGLLIFRFIELQNKNGLRVQSFLVICLIILCLRFILYKHWILQSLQNSDLFDPEIYASSVLLPSMGDLVLHIIFFLLIFYSFTRIKNRMFLYIPASGFEWIKASVLCLLYAFGTDLVFSIIKSLVVDSNISFHFSDLPKINVYSFLSLTIIGVLMGSLVYIAEFLFTVSGFRHLKTKTQAIALFLTFLLYGLFQHYNGHMAGVSIFVTILFCSIIYIWLIFRPSIKDFYLNILILLMISGFAAFIINFQNKKHEQEYLNVFVNKIYANQDLEAEGKFAMMEQKLIKEFITPQDFQNFFKQQDEYEKRIKNLFFSGYLDKFELKIISFDSNNVRIGMNPRYPFKLLDSIYSFESYPTISNHFYHIKKQAGVRGYIAKFETCNLHGNFGSVFLLLQPKIIQSSHSYPDIINSKNQQTVFEFKEYSYAIYQNNTLISQKGDYPYRLAIPTGELMYNDKNVFSLPGYKHFISSPVNDIKIVISKRKDYLVKSFALFSFMFIYFTVLGVLFALLWSGIYIARFGWNKFAGKNRGNAPLLDLLSKTLPLISAKQRMLSSRIQVSMVGLVFFGLVVSVFFTIQYVRYNYNQRQQDQLYLKLKEIMNQLENEPDLSRKLRSNERLRALVNYLSDANRIDLNIFDKSGLLLASTQPVIYNEYFLAKLMDPVALYKLRNENASQLLQKEKVMDFEYLSGYVPLFNDENKIKAYLNLPYFTEKSEIDKEISSFLVSLINIYFLLLLIAIIIAYFIGQRISLPLQIIREKLSKTSISMKNEIIEWKRDDEIGQLVKQYNKMVIELEESAHKLSESEREGAWKEMARQVAHEIKNPLTPMKLNIQHLQRAWNSDREGMDASFKRVTGILIEQIDSLSRLATEFSSFAKMPTDLFLDCRIDKVLLSTIHLFEQSENVLIEYDKNLKPITVYTDPEQISRVFTNIIKNAIQSIPPEREGIITISCKVSDEKVIVGIRDNGTGISDDLKNRIFVPSFSTKNSGMGLGLAISKKIVENSGGEISFNSEPGKGSEFFIVLPLKKV